VYQYEGGGIAFNSGCSINLIDGDRGRLNATQVLQAINVNDVHKANSSLVCLENTSNRGGGSCYNFNDIEAIKKVCKENNLALHLDGARLFNAIIAKQENAKQYGEVFNSISICLSKGLGAPVGSILIGSKSFIAKARRIRKVFGGGMRQAGYIAAAGLYAMQNHIERLSIDHQHAKMIAETLQTLAYVDEIKPVETNIIIFSCKGKYTSQQLVEVLKQHQILAYTISPTQVRLVLHLDISETMVERTIKVLKGI
jgi:threonine aldolase